MAQMILGTTAQSLSGGRGRPIIQNLGPGLVYFNTDAECTPTNGIQIEVGGSFEFVTQIGDETIVSLIADTAGTDVRVITMGA